MADLMAVVLSLKDEYRRVQAEGVRIQRAIRALRSLGTGNSSSSRPRRTMSAAARRKIGQAKKGNNILD